MRDRFSVLKAMMVVGLAFFVVGCVRHFITADTAPSVVVDGPRTIYLLGELVACSNQNVDMGPGSYRDADAVCVRQGPADGRAIQIPASYIVEIVLYRNARLQVFP